MLYKLLAITAWFLWVLDKATPYSCKVQSETCWISTHLTESDRASKHEGFWLNSSFPFSLSIIFLQLEHWKRILVDVFFFVENLQPNDVLSETKYSTKAEQVSLWDNNSWSVFQKIVGLIKLSFRVFLWFLLKTKANVYLKSRRTNSTCDLTLAVARRCMTPDMYVQANTLYKKKKTTTTVKCSSLRLNSSCSPKHCKFQTVMGFNEVYT